jgi:hypothetical protein
MVRVALDDRLGKLWMLVKRSSPYLGAVGFRLEPEADVVPDAHAQVEQVRVVCRVRDRPVQREVGHPRRVAILPGLLVVVQRAAQNPVKACASGDVRAQAAAAVATIQASTMASSCQAS